MNLNNVFCMEESNHIWFHIYFSADYIIAQPIHLPMPNDVYICPSISPPSVQIMACRLFGAEPLYEPLFSFCQLDHSEQTSVKFGEKDNNFC